MQERLSRNISKKPSPSFNLPNEIGEHLIWLSAAHVFVLFVHLDRVNKPLLLLDNFILKAVILSAADLCYYADDLLNVLKNRQQL